MWLQRAAPAVGPKPEITFITPGGSPACWATQLAKTNSLETCLFYTGQQFLVAQASRETQQKEISGKTILEHKGIEVLVKI